MIKKKYLTKKIWFDDNLWDLVQVFSPNKYEDWLILARETNYTHGGEETPAFQVVAIQNGNDDWFPDTKKVRELIEQQREIEIKNDKSLKDVVDALYQIHHDIWYDQPEACKW